MRVSLLWAKFDDYRLYYGVHIMKSIIMAMIFAQENKVWISLEFQREFQCFHSVLLAIEHRLHGHKCIRKSDYTNEIKFSIELCSPKFVILSKWFRFLNFWIRTSKFPKDWPPKSRSFVVHPHDFSMRFRLFNCLSNCLLNRVDYTLWSFTI